jgi:hypothetical protein
MAAHNPLVIASVNMRKRNATTHALLNSNTTDNLILIQEPWFDKIGTARKDNEQQGVDVLGGVASPAWEILYPSFKGKQRPKVMAYARKHNPGAPHFSAVPRLDLSTHPTLQIIDVVFDNEKWQVINFYHDVLDITSRQALLALDIDAITPTLVIGDFNTHSRTWSPPDVARSTWANDVEEWAAANLLALANTPGEVTRRGAEHERDSVIDLAWYNEAATQAATFSDLRLDWDGSLASDHAMLHVTGLTREATPTHHEETNPGFVIDPEKSDEWTRAFKARSHPHPLRLIPTPEEVETAAASFMNDIQQTNEEVFHKRRPHHPKAAPWWSAGCAIATQNLRSARGRAARGTAHARLKGAVRTAKRRWADEYIEKAQLWEVAAWRHGRRLTKVPALQGPGGLVHSHDEVANILSQRFFPQTPPEVPTRFPDDPPPHPTRALAAVDNKLIEPLLMKAAGRSAPGQSGHTWTILKWAWGADPDRITDLLSACLRAGHHPRLWKEAVVCVIPKPGRADYTLAKNFRPISLLECLGKLLEKVVAKLIYRDMSKHALVPSTQFGGRNASSTLDAGLTLLHDIQAAHQTGLRTGILLFDIQGFFDNINHNRLIQVFTDLGFAPELVGWCRSFLKERTVRLKFNGKTSDPFDFTVGAPQGSPVSPVLSIIYTSPLLHKMRAWTNSSLGMYVDDGVIFACGKEWADIQNTMRFGYSECAEWLTRAGLNIEPDKTELLFFRKRMEKVDPPANIRLPTSADNITYQVPATITLRYLGFFFDARLSWTHHVDVVCNRARASLKALKLLGNSVRGLDQAKWRLAYNAICLPVLTYGCQLWYTGKQVTLVKKLQRVQNDAVRIISGTFRTTPLDPLHQLLTILPIKLRLDMLIQNTALRLYRAPKGSQLLRRLGVAWQSPTPGDLPLPSPNRPRAKTTLRALAARVPVNGPRVDPFPDIPQGAPTWNGRVRVNPKQRDLDYDQVSEQLTNACRNGTLVTIYCEATYSNRNREDGKQLGAAAATLYHEGRERGHCEEVFGESVTEADAHIRALGPGLDALALFLTGVPTLTNLLFIFLLPSNTALTRTLDASPHEEQERSLDHLERIGELLLSYPNISLQLQWLPRTAPFIGFRRSKQLAFEAIRVTDIAGLAEPQTIKKQKKSTREAAVKEWADRWHEAPRTSLAYRTALTGPPDGRAHFSFLTTRPASPPTTNAAAPTTHTPERTNREPAKVKFSRSTHSTFYRFTTGHAFTGDYTRRFYPLHTPEQVACPCGEPIQTVEHVLTTCPLYDAARQRHLNANGRPRTLPQLFANAKRVQALLRFLEETRACAKPRATWEPG